MSIKYPDEVKHSNDSYALVDVNSSRGRASVVDKITRNSSPLDKRKLLAVFQVGTERHVYLSSDISDIAWQDDINWQVDKDVFTLVDGSNIEASKFLESLDQTINGSFDFYIDTDALVDGDGSVGSPWQQMSGFSNLLKYQVLGQSINITVNVSGSLPLDITIEDQSNFKTVKNLNFDNSILILGGVTQIASITSVVKDTTFPAKFSITSVDFDNTADLYSHEFVKAGSGYQPISGSGNDGVDNYIITDPSRSEAQLLGGGIYTPSTKVRIDGTQGVLCLGVIASITQFKYLTLTNLDCVTNNTFTYQIGTESVYAIPFYNNCKMDIGTGQVNIYGRNTDFARCSFTCYFNLNDSNSMTTQRFINCVVHGIRSQNGLANSIITNLQIIHDNTTTCINLSNGVHNLRGLTTVLTKNTNSIIHVGQQYAIESLIMDLNALYIMEYGATTAQVINYSTSLNVACNINVPVLVGNYTALSNLSDTELSNPESQRKVTVNGRDVAFSKKSIVQFATVAEVNTIGSEYPFLLCKETNRMYVYVTSNTSTVDNDLVLATSDGGDTRFIDPSLVAPGGTIILSLKDVTEDQNIADYFPTDYHLMSMRSIEKNGFQNAVNVGTTGITNFGLNYIDANRDSFQYSYGGTGAPNNVTLDGVHYDYLRVAPIFQSPKPLIITSLDWNGSRIDFYFALLKIK